MIRLREGRTAIYIRNILAALLLLLIGFCFAYTIFHIRESDNKNEVSNYAGEINVKDYGAKGDNVADDTRAIQAALDALAEEGAAVLYFPPSIYKITSPLIVPFMQGKEIRGATSLQSTVQQHTNNVAVFQFTYPDTHSIYMHDLGISYRNQQKARDGNAYGIGFGSTQGSPNGFYHLMFERLSIAGAAVGIGINQKSGTQTVWNFSLSDTSFASISKHVIYFNPPTPIGMPMHVYNNIRVMNTGNGIAPKGEAFVFTAVEAEIEHLDIEGWHNTIFYGIGGPNYVVRHVHVEHHVFDEGADKDLFYLANGSLTVENLAYQGVSNNTTSVQLFHSDTPEANLYLKQIVVGMSRNKGGAVVIATQQSTAFIQDVRTNIPVTYPLDSYEKHVRGNVIESN
ncbi:glycosyl hydrolase family 28-related protein [Cohnella abietis]|nr:glycosyl hydrolase family 28-related protein [Cohnella abietis]